MPISWPGAWTAAVPGRCAVCGAWPARPVCAECVAQFGAPRARCRRCALPLPAAAAPVCGACLRTPPPLVACLAAVDYAYPWSGLVARCKFTGEPGWAQWLAELLRTTPGVTEAVERADRVLPIPLSPQRLAARGYNQAHELARRLAPDRVHPRLLRRVRETDPQSALPRAAREANVRGAFALEARAAPAVAAARLLLVDDVMTSGASLHAAARVLLAAGAAEVAAVVVARTPPPAA